MLASVRVDEAERMLVFVEQHDQTWALHDLERHRRLDTAGGTNGQAVGSWIVGVYNLLELLSTIGRKGKVVAQRLGEIGRIRSLPDTGQIRDVLRANQGPEGNDP